MLIVKNLILFKNNKYYLEIMNIIVVRLDGIYQINTFKLKCIEFVVDLLYLL